MKTITLFAAVALLANTAFATEIINGSRAAKSYETETRFNANEPIAFMERGIEFFVFPNGEFDFNTEASTGSGIYYKNGRRNGINGTYGAPGNASDGVKIEHDAQGRVRRVGNVFLNYDSRDRIKRIGSVYMTYSRMALTQIGGLRMVYNTRGQIVNMIGSVKGNQAYAYQNTHNGAFSNSTNYNDNDFYYYKGDGTKVKVDNKTIVKEQ